MMPITLITIWLLISSRLPSIISEDEVENDQIKYRIPTSVYHSTTKPYEIFFKNTFPTDIVTIQNINKTELILSIILMINQYLF